MPETDDILWMRTIPVRWLDSTSRRWRCVNGHVDVMSIKSERLGYDACVRCDGLMLYTFPEDADDNTLGAEVYAIRRELYDLAARAPRGKSA